jgi:hypothetical protein
MEWEELQGIVEECESCGHDTTITLMQQYQKKITLT